MEHEQGESTIPGLPIETVLQGLRIPALPDGATARGVIALVLLDGPDGPGWAVRVTAGIDSDEELGVLTGYVEHLRQVSAAGWDQLESTRPSSS